jgi:hypothetical protein
MAAVFLDQPHDRRRGAAIPRTTGYRLPPFLVR